VTEPSSAPAYPLWLDLSGRPAVVVGGGPVAARRVRGLLEAGAGVQVVAPLLCEDLAELAAAEAITWVAREYAAGDLDGAWLVHTATGTPAVDEAVAAAADAARVWCVRAGDAEASSAWVPAVTRTPEVSVAVSGAGDPRRAMAVRDAIAVLLDTGALPVRRHRAGPGSVALVGGGPGDPGLLTTRGRRLLAAADVVVVDRLAPLALLDTLADDVTVIDVGKSPDNHPVPQHDINRLLVEHARAGRRVVRLKGGDPYLLGRGGEELAACREAGVEVEMVPGVTSALAVPAVAGIPVTHRGVARQVTIASGHEGLDWPSLAALEGTLVLLMGVTLLERTTRELVEHGKAPDTPVAVVESGFSPRQRTTIGTLATIAALARDRDVRSPAVIVVGDVVGLAERLA
jgi:uroporphyrin-III C-methyltransferase/precorrin-2 dehydrogenase/sirohydrochlorin ferrochelatase